MSIPKLGFYVAVVLAVTPTYTPVEAQQRQQQSQQPKITLPQLAAQGFEIKAATPSAFGGAATTVFLQNNSTHDTYSCEIFYTSPIKAASLARETSCELIK
jgi:hypothetical protein